jgi:hypothetical protein
MGLGLASLNLIVSFCLRLINVKYYSYIMGSLNQFKLVKQKSKRYFDVLEKDLGRNIKLDSDVDKERFGFYLYILECVTSIKEIDQLLEMVTDQDFNKKIFSKTFDDQGIDAIHIDSEKNEINLFNFKYRENYGSKQSVNDVFISTKFTSALVNSDFSSLQGKLKEKAKKIISNLQSNDIWKLTLYMVSNESVGLESNDPSIDQLKQLYDLEIRSLSLDEIYNFMSIRPKPISAKLVLNNEAILSYSESPLSSAKSYIIRLSVPELIRITCDNSGFRDEYNIEDLSKLSGVKLDFAVLFDNVRGFLGKTKYNENILDTLKNEPSKFFMYNNGITMTAEQIDGEDINAKTKIKLELKNLQIVNGGQTIRSIHDFNSSDKGNIGRYLSNAEILVRLFKTPPDSKLTNKIAEYTNSQNAISVIDLKSLAYEQIEIEKFLEGHNIIYARKIGDTGRSDKEYEYKISLEKFGQILFSINGNPEKASNQKKRIFDKHYEETFGEENFDITQSAEIIKEYHKIKKIYNSEFLNLDATDQKIFYILYLNKKRKNDINDNILFLEKCISEYKSDKHYAPARKLIQKGFKDLLDSKINS